MSEYFDAVLAQTPAPRTPSQRRRICREFITRLTGRQTIYQCLELARLVRDSGMAPLPAEVCTRQRICAASSGISRGAGRPCWRASPPLPFLVPGTLELLTRVRRRGVTCYLASGTDIAYVRREARMLGLDTFFGAGTGTTGSTAPAPGTGASPSASSSSRSSTPIP